MSELTWKATLHVDRAHADACADAFYEAIELETSAVSVGAGPLGEATIEVYLLEEPSNHALRTVIDRFEEATGARTGEITVEPVEHQDWVSLGLSGLTPVTAGRFFVHGGHDAALRPGGGGVSIEIDAGQAFGTGHHGSTEGALRMIDRRLGRRPVRQSLDVGCGTGVLAIALARATRRPVVASDIDPVSVQVTRDNARKNGVAPLVRAVTANGMDHPAIRSGGPYDLIVANILARPLVRLSGPITERLAPGGEVILSGFLASQERMVAAPYLARGLRLVSRKALDEWVTARFRK